MPENQLSGLGCGPLKEPGKQMSSSLSLMPNFAHTGKETPCGIMIKFRIWVDIRGVMTYATCGANRLWRLGVV